MRIYSEKNAVLEFAASELRKYTDMILRSGKAEEKIYLGCSREFCISRGISVEDLRYDGYKIVKSGDGWAFVSAMPRGVLFAVYDFLSDNGCKFVRAGGVGETVGRRDKLVFCEKTENPDLEIRGLINCTGEINDEWAKETVEIIDWAAKNRLNMIFLHQSVGGPLSRENDAVAKEILKRGMQFEFGGHGVQDYVERSLFDVHPEYFIEKDGKRVPQGNICVSSDEAVSVITENILNLLRKSVRIDVLHVWFEDVISGSWCECEKCRKLKPILQMKKVVDAIARAVKKEFPLVKIDLLLYHDTIDQIAEIGDIEDNVIIEYAPRERCYAHSLEGDGCELNAGYARKLKDAVARYGGEKVAIFEYYMDFILFSKVKTVLSGTIAKDLEFYRKVGVKSVAPLSFGPYSFWAYDVNMAVYAKHAFHTDLDEAETVVKFLRDLGLPDNFKEYVALCEQFCKEYFAFCGYKDIRDDIRCLPLCDYFGEHLKKIERAVGILEKAAKWLEENSGSCLYCELQKKCLDISLTECKGLMKRMRARYSNYRHPEMNKRELIEELDEVKRGLYEIIRKIRVVPVAVKGVQGVDLFEEHLCKDQIWTVNELMNKEFKMNVSLDRSII